MISLGLQRVFKETYLISVFYIFFSKGLDRDCEMIFFFYFVWDWTLVSCYGTSRNWVKWLEIKVAIYPEMILLEALLYNILSITVFVVDVILVGELIVR